MQSIVNVSPVPLHELYICNVYSLDSSNSVLDLSLSIILCNRPGRVADHFQIKPKRFHLMHMFAQKFCFDLQCDSGETMHVSPLAI